MLHQGRVRHRLRQAAGRPPLIINGLRIWLSWTIILSMFSTLQAHVVSSGHIPAGGTSQSAGTQL